MKDISMIEIEKFADKTKLKNIQEFSNKLKETLSDFKELESRKLKAKDNVKALNEQLKNIIVDVDEVLNVDKREKLKIKNRRTLAIGNKSHGGMEKYEEGARKSVE